MKAAQKNKNKKNNNYQNNKIAEEIFPTSIYRLFSATTI
jgi:hypothetical protein